MKPDRYTKIVLTFIALALIAIASNRYVNPETTQAQGSFSGVQFSATPRGDEFFDSRTGELWWYNEDGNLAGKYRLSKLGQPLK